MSVVVKIQTLRENRDTREEVLGERVVIGNTIGDCLDALAPDPSDTAIFKVFVVNKEALHA